MTTLKEVWLSVKEASELLNIPLRTMKEYCNKGKYNTKKVEGNGGLQYRIQLSSLPIEAQKKYIERQIPDQVEKQETKLTGEEDILEYSKARGYNKRKADKYVLILNSCVGFVGKKLKVWVDIWNRKHPDLKTSYPRIMEARKKITEEGYKALVGNYGKRIYSTRVVCDWLEHFKRNYLNENAPSASSCYFATYGYAKQMGYNIERETFPHLTTFIRRLDKEISKEVQCRARYGEKVWDREYGHSVNRDWTLITSSLAWFSDHHQINVAVRGNNDRVYFPWVTPFCDARSNKWLGWSLHLDPPRADHIFLAFYYATMEYGLPYYIYIDNGKDFRCRDFAGGRIKRNSIKVEIDEQRASALLTFLNITPIFARPYNAKAKRIERQFKTVDELFSKHMIGYRGANVTERPEKLADEIKHNKIMDFNEFSLLFDDFIINILNKKESLAKGLEGKSPDQVFTENWKEKRYISKDSLMIFCMRTSTEKTIRENGIEDSELGEKMHYWAEWMSGNKGLRVYMRRDPKNYAEAYVFRAGNDEFIGTALLSEAVNPIAVTEVDRQKLKKAIEQSRRDAKKVKELAKVETLNPIEYFNNMKKAVSTDKPLLQVTPQSINIIPTAMDNVASKKKEMEKEGTQDISMLVPLPVQKKKLFLFEYEKEDEIKKQSGGNE